MKSWMIWAGAGLLGIALAAVLLPWAASPTVVEPLPQVDGAPMTAQTSTPTTASGTPITPSTPVVSPSSEGPDTVLPPPPIGTVNDGDGVDEEGEAWVNDARYDRQQLLNRPDMVAVRNLGSRWRAMRRMVADMDHDPAGDHTMNRIQVLQTDLRAYRRNPEGKDFEELLARQTHILGELKQTSYWGPELQEMEGRVLDAAQEYRASK